MSVGRMTEDKCVGRGLCNKSFVLPPGQLLCWGGRINQTDKNPPSVAASDSGSRRIWVTTEIMNCSNVGRRPGFVFFPSPWAAQSDAETSVTNSIASVYWQHLVPIDLLWIATITDLLPLDWLPLDLRTVLG